MSEKNFAYPGRRFSPGESFHCFSCPNFIHSFIYKRLRFFCTPKPITGVSYFAVLLSCTASSIMTASSYLGNKLVQMGTKIVGIGRNYAAHAKEMGAAIPKEPLIFLKPTSSYVREGSSVEIPSSCTFLDHEVELGVVIGKKGRDIPESLAMDHVSGYALALDMTARELQAVAKKQGLPWTLAKGYDTFTPIGNFIPKKQVPNLSDLELWLEVDGKLRQKGSTNDMIFSVPVLISYISTIMTLNEGDVILTGTPSGVGPVKAGQHMKAGITGLAEVSFEVKARKPVRA